MKKYFLKLYNYNYWSNKRVLGAIQKQNIDDAKILQLMGHVLAAQYLWLHRIESLPTPDVKLWGDYTLPRLLEMAEEIGTRWLAFVERNDNFDRELTYRNYTNDPYTNNVENIMIHLVNHSSYHRAQVAMLMRQQGLEPVNTDFITYDRVITGQWKE